MRKTQKLQSLMMILVKMNRSLQEKGGTALAVQQNLLEQRSDTIHQRVKMAQKKYLKQGAGQM